MELLSSNLYMELEEIDGKLHLDGQIGKNYKVNHEL